MPLRLVQLRLGYAWALQQQGRCAACGGSSPRSPQGDGAAARRSRTDESRCTQAILAPSQAHACCASAASTHPHARKLKEGRPPEPWWDWSIQASKSASLQHSNRDVRQLGASPSCKGGHSPQTSCGATTHRPRITKSRIGTDRALPDTGRLTETMLPLRPYEGVCRSPQVPRTNCSVSPLVRLPSRRTVCSVCQLSRCGLVGTRSRLEVCNKEFTIDSRGRTPVVRML